MDKTYRKLPTRWIILDENKRIIANDIGRAAIAMATKRGRFYMAKCHYRIGENGEEYLTEEDQIAELLERRTDPECPYDAPIVSQKSYGIIK